MTEAHLNILHDHYKETFSHIREREKLRDRLFLVVIALYGFIAFQIQYPPTFKGALEAISIFETKINLSTLPLAAFLTATWVITLAIVIRYCQSCIHTDRQYDYLHHLEKTISASFEDKEVYCREGAGYLKNYPLFSKWSWFFYIILFPSLLITTTCILLYIEAAFLGYPRYHIIFDLIIGGGIIFSFVSYRFIPPLRKWWQKSRVARRITN